jgi:hypothetical protein
MIEPESESKPLLEANILNGEVYQLLDVTLCYVPKTLTFMVSTPRVPSSSHCSSYEEAVRIFDKLLEDAYMFDWENYNMYYSDTLEQIERCQQCEGESWHPQTVHELILELFEEMSETDDYEMALGIKDGLIDHLGLPEDTILTINHITNATYH